MIDWIKEHPYLTGSLVVGIFILYLVYKNSQSSAASSGGGTQTIGPSDSLQAVAIQANAGIQAATLSAQEKVAGYNAAVAVNAQNTGADVQKAQLQQNTNLQYILSSADVTNHKTAAAVQLGLAQTGATVAIASIEQGGTIPFSVVGRGTVAGAQANAANTQAPIINAAVGAMPSPTNPGTSASNPGLAAVFAANTPPASVQALNPSFFTGYTAGEGAPVPSAAGIADYNAYHSLDLASLPNAAPGGVVNSQTAGYDSAAIDAANYEFLHDPNSCHNVVCDASGRPVAATPTTATPAPGPSAPVPGPTNNLVSNAAVLQTQLGYNPSTLLPQSTYLAQLSAQQNPANTSPAQRGPGGKYLPAVAPGIYETAFTDAQWSQHMGV